MASKYLAEDPYERLANAIVLQAVMDYRAALRRLKKNPDRKELLDTVMIIEKFFHSEWYQILTNVDAAYLINKIRKEIVEAK